MCVCVCVCARAFVHLCVCVCVVYTCLIKYGSQCDVALCFVLFFNRRVGALGISSKDYILVNIKSFKNQILLGGCFPHGSDLPNPNPYICIPGRVSESAALSAASLQLLIHISILLFSGLKQIHST